MEDEKLFPIGEVARLYRMSVGNLRHYEKIGLLNPEYVNPDSGYRYYSVKQFECLNTIRYLRALDMPLESIKAFLTNRDTDNLQEILSGHKETVCKKRRELELIERKIDSRINKLQDALNSDFDTISVKKFPERRFAILKKSIVPKNYLSLEGSLRELDAASDSIFLGKVGLGLTSESLCQGIFSPYELVFIQLDDEDSYRGSITRVGAENCVTVRFRGGHENAEVYYRRLLTYIKKSRLTVSGFSKEITLIDYGFTNNVKLFVTEIQIPIK